MARTKRTRLPETVNAGQMTIVNESSQAFFSNVINRFGWGRYRYGSRINVRPENRSVIQLETYKTDPVVSWTIPIRNYGVLVCDGSSDESLELVYNEEEIVHEMTVVPGGTYRLIDDPRNPLLTEAQFSAIIPTLVKILEEPAPYSSLWDTALKRLPSDLVVGRNAENLSRAFYSSEYRYNIRSPNWQNLYRLVRLNLHTGDWITQHALSRALVPGGMARIDVYWRALDRRPGGNTDQHTVCYTFDCAKQTLSTRSVHNSDDALWRCEYRPENLSAKVASNDPTGPFPSFLTALRSLGGGESECTIMDMISRDAQEYDTTWTSHEILVWLPLPWSTTANKQFSPSYREVIRQVLIANNQFDVKLPVVVMQKVFEYAAPLHYVPVARLHQRCLPGPQYHGYRSDQDVQPNDTQKLVLQTVQDLVGMGRVNSWSDAGDDQPPCPAKVDPKLDMICDDSCTCHVPFYIHPFYFHFLARNCVPAEVVAGTSKEWKAEENE